MMTLLIRHHPYSEDFGLKNSTFISKCVNPSKVANFYSNFWLRNGVLLFQATDSLSQTTHKQLGNS